MKLRQRITQSIIAIKAMPYLLLMVIGILTSLTCCDKDDSEPTILTGTWKLVKQGPQTVDYDEYLEFRENGTLIMTNCNNSGLDIEYPYKLEDDWSYNEKDQYYRGRIHILEPKKSQPIILSLYYSCYIDSENKTMSLCPWFDHDVYFFQDPTSYYIKIK